MSRQYRFPKDNNSKLGPPLADTDAATERQKKIDQDLHFQARMRAAIRAGAESQPIGVDTRPGTENPQPWQPPVARIIRSSMGDV